MKPHSRAAEERATLEAPDTCTSADDSAEDKKTPALIQEVIQTLGRVDVFDTDSLKALRSTCWAFRDLVDATGVASSASFNLAGGNPYVISEIDGGGLKDLEAWASLGGRWLQRTRSLFIQGDVPAELVGTVLTAITSVASSISKMKLLSVGPVAQGILSLPLGALCELTVSSYGRTGPVITDFMNPSFTQLRSLALKAGPGITDAAALASTLAYFPKLKSLKIEDFTISGANVASGILSGTLNHLEMLHLHHCGRIEKVGLLGDGGPNLPALRSFYLDFTMYEIQPRPWTGQLTRLELRHVAVNPAFVAALHAGPLKELAFDPDSGAREVVFDWKSLDLPHLTRLELGLYSGDAMGAVARGTMPLRSASIHIGHNTAADRVYAFAVAFPHLCDLTLLQYEDPRCWEEPPSAAAVQAPSRELVPRLESLKWLGDNTSIKLLVQNLLPRGHIRGGMRCQWPFLRSLDVDLDNDDNDVGALLPSLAHAAPHCPSLVSLRLCLGAIRVHVDTVKAFIRAARDVHAWPLLRVVELV